MIDIDEYLPANTLKFCFEFLKTQNFDPWNPAIPQADKVETPYLLVYLKF